MAQKPEVQKVSEDTESLVESDVNKDQEDKADCVPEFQDLNLTPSPEK